MSLSDRDRDLAKKHGRYVEGIKNYCQTEIDFTETQLTAFLAERDALAIKEKDDDIEVTVQVIYHDVEISINYPDGQDISFCQGFSEQTRNLRLVFDKDSKELKSAQAIRTLIKPRD
jgi:hypothetical protein